MKIAVTYENGEVFQHFGHTEAFKIYEVEGGRIAGGSVVQTDGSGHGALAGFLSERGVDALICGGIGGGARAACMLSVFWRMRFFTWNECVWIDGASSGNSGALARTSSK